MLGFKIGHGTSTPRVCSLPGEWGPLLTDIGETNIRKMLYSGDPSQTSVSCGTYGIIYRVSKEDDEKLHAIYGFDRVRIGQYVHARNPAQPTGVVGVPVVIYWDPRNTRDGWNYHRWSSGNDVKTRWAKALETLKGQGVPTFWLAHVASIVQGLKENCSKVFDDSGANSFEIKPHDNTIYVNPQDLSYTPPTTDKPPTPVRIHVNRGRPQGQPVTGRAEEAISRTQTPRSQSTSKPHVQATAGRAEQPVARQAIPSKPQSAAISQAAPRPQGQPTVGQAEQTMPRARISPSESQSATRPQAQVITARAEQVMLQQPTPSKPQSITSTQSTSVPQGQVTIGRAQQVMSTQPTPSKPQATTPPHPASKPQGQSANGKAEQAIPRQPTLSKPQSTTPPRPPPKLPGQATIVGAGKAIPRAPTSSKPQPEVKPQGQSTIGRAQQIIPKQIPPVKPQSVTQLQSAPRPQSATSPQSANPGFGTKAQPIKRLSTSIPNGLGLNLKVSKKRKPDSNDDEGQPMKKQMSKKQPPGPSNLRHETPA
jgi:hypothetical protein